MATYRLKILGCKTSRADAEALERRLESLGMAPAPEGEPVDVSIVCGCAVTAAAEAKSRKALRKIARENPGSVIVAAGCLAARPDAARAGGAEVLVPPVEMLSWTPDLSGPPASETLAARRRTRGIIKVQDGCDCGCAYCIVPSLRGEMRSVPPGLVLAEAEHLLEEGHSEIVMTGVRLGAYSSGGLSLSGLVRNLTRLEAKGLSRLRLSSIEPMDLGERNAGLIDLAARGGALCPHFHLPLQSADRGVLARMGRPYTDEDYLRLVERIRAAIPDAAITTDMIAGFPGEDDEAHGRSVRAVGEIGFARVHAFQFSPREGTRAAAMPGQVEDQVAAARAADLASAGEASARKYREAFVGRRVRVIAEAGGRGYTERYVPVVIGEGVARGQTVDVAVAGDDGSALYGHIVGADRMEAVAR